jgi:antitoxin VapB
MTIRIEDPVLEALLAELVSLTGETATDALVTALRERLAALREDRQAQWVTPTLNQIGSRCGQLPSLDDRTDDDILGYDAATGLPETSAADR